MIYGHREDQALLKAEAHARIDNLMTQLPLELRAYIDVQKSKGLTGSVLNHVINLASTTGADKERLWELKKAIENLWHYLKMQNSSVILGIVNK